MATKGFLASHDDSWFPTKYATFVSMYDWLYFRYHSWSGRLAIETILPLVLKANVWVWRLLNIAAFITMAMGIYFLGGAGEKQIPAKKHWLACVSIVILVFVVEKKVLEFGMFWATGSMNYLWPTACLCVALVPYSQLLRGQAFPNAIWALIAVPLVYASYQEQTALILLCFVSVTVVFLYLRDRYISVPGIVFAAVVAINFYLLISAPGNYIRMEVEIVKFYPDFNTVSIMQKIYAGVNYTVLNHWLLDSVKPFLVISVLTCYLTYKKTVSRVALVCVYFPLFYIVFCIICSRGLGGDFGQLLNLDIYGTVESLTGTKTFDLKMLPVVLGGMTMLLIPLSWIFLFEEKETLLGIVLFYFAAVFASLIISFSPTMFASGYRVFFVPDMMMIIVAFTLFRESLDFIEPTNKIFILGYSLLALDAVSNIIGFAG